MIIKAIRRIPLLSEMDATVLNRCIAENQLVVRHYAKGATVHHQHEACSVLDVVLSGKLVAYSLSENGSAITMFEFQKDSIIGAKIYPYSDEVIILQGDGQFYYFEKIVTD